MKVLIISPSLAPHGGVRVLVEHANGFAAQGHDVTLQVVQHTMKALPNWVTFHEDVEIDIGDTRFNPAKFDAVIYGSPFMAVRFHNHYRNANAFMLLQMCEELFNPNDANYVKQAIESYHLPIPIIGISQWNKDRILDVHKRDPILPYHLIGNGVSDSFCPGIKDDGLTVLVEGWVGYNPAKDTEAIAPRVAKHLKEKYGARIIAYSQFPLAHPQAKHKDVPDEYYVQPTLDQIVRLNQRATFLLKASKFDARSCAPVEAMECRTPTVRAIDMGDDDLIHKYNCLRGVYNYDEMICNAEMMIEIEYLCQTLAEHGMQYAETNLSWPHWSNELFKIISQ
jgi:glycosyltransferase involved in cell wall biosynthesis